MSKEPNQPLTDDEFIELRKEAFTTLLQYVSVAQVLLDGTPEFDWQDKNNNRLILFDDELPVFTAGKAVLEELLVILVAGLAEIDALDEGDELERD